MLSTSWLAEMQAARSGKKMDEKLTSVEKKNLIQHLQNVAIRRKHMSQRYQESMRADVHDATGFSRR